MLVYLPKWCDLGIKETQEQRKNDVVTSDPTFGL